MEEAAKAKVEELQAAELPSREPEDVAEEAVAKINQQLKKDKEAIEATVSQINEQLKKDKQGVESERTPQIDGLNEERDEIDAQVADLEELRVGLLLTEGR